MVEQRDINIVLDNPIDWECFRGKTILITAATGRIGMFIVEALSEATIRWNLDTTIILHARNEEKLKKVFAESLSLPYIVQLIQDITVPFEYEGDVDYIFHTAGMASPLDFTNKPVDTLWGHVQGTRNILELARTHNCKKVLYVSTVEIYGTWENDKEIKEIDMGAMRCDNARACYPEAKRLCEAMLAAYEKQYHIPYVGVRLCHTFGPGISLVDGRAFSEFILDVLEHRDIVLQSDGSAVRTYTYTADAVGAMLIAFTRGTHHYYNIANLKNEISIRDLAELIASFDSLGKSKVKQFGEPKGKLQYLPFKLGIMDCSRIENLGWVPKVGLQDAFRWTINSFQQNGQKE